MHTYLPPSTRTPLSWMSLLMSFWVKEESVVQSYLHWWGLFHFGFFEFRCFICLLELWQMLQIWEAALPECRDHRAGGRAVEFMLALPALAMVNEQPGCVFKFTLLCSVLHAGWRALKTVLAYNSCVHSMLWQVHTELYKVSCHLVLFLSWQCARLMFRKEQCAGSLLKLYEGGFNVLNNVTAY